MPPARSTAPQVGVANPEAARHVRSVFPHDGRGRTRAWAKLSENGLGKTRLPYEKADG